MKTKHKGSASVIILMIILFGIAAGISAGVIAMQMRDINEITKNKVAIFTKQNDTVERVKEKYLSIVKGSGASNQRELNQAVISISHFSSLIPSEFSSIIEVDSLEANTGLKSTSAIMSMCIKDKYEYKGSVTEYAIDLQLEFIYKPTGIIVKTKQVYR